MSELITKLFAGPEGKPVTSRRMAVLQRDGKPFLYLPASRRSAAFGLGLYPAQRLVARMTKALLRGSCAAGLVRLLPQTTITICPESRLGQFLATASGQTTPPQFAALAGNPNAPGQRLILLVFDTNGQPALVVKIGTNPEAMRLVRREAGLLQSIPPAAEGLPRVRAVLESEGLSAFAMDYLAGNPPGPKFPDPMPALLHSWLDPHHEMFLNELPAWNRLTTNIARTPLTQRLWPVLESKKIHPALYHGDFAPWNIRGTRNGAWHALDWERGELEGPPCWDWFHYHIQVGILVTRLSEEGHVRHIEKWIETGCFAEYSRAAGAWEIRREMLLAYLLHCREVWRPAEGRAETASLLDTLGRRWFDLPA